MVGAPTTMVFPQRDDDGNLLETQYGRSRFRDQQVRPSAHQGSLLQYCVRGSAEAFGSARSMGAEW